MEGNCIYDKNKTILNTVWGQPTSISISEGVKSIGYMAFGDQKKLLTVHFSDSVERIEGAAFYSCTALKNIYLGNGLKEIGGIIFSGCSSLTSIEIPNTIESIASNAFANWPQAKTIRIHKKKGEITGMPWGANLGDRAIIWDD